MDPELGSGSKRLNRLGTIKPASCCDRNSSVHLVGLGSPLSVEDPGDPFKMVLAFQEISH